MADAFQWEGPGLVFDYDEGGLEAEMCQVFLCFFVFFRAFYWPVLRLFICTWYTPTWPSFTFISVWASYAILGFLFFSFFSLEGGLLVFVLFITVIPRTFCHTHGTASVYIPRKFITWRNLKYFLESIPQKAATGPRTIGTLCILCSAHMIHIQIKFMGDFF